MGRVELLPPVYRTSIKIFTEQKKVKDGDEIKVDNFFHNKSLCQGRNFTKTLVNFE